MTDPSSLDLAIIRYSVVCQQWSRIGGDCYLHAFLAGWFCRAVGATEPANVGQFRDSFRAGWQQSNEQQVIAAREREEVFQDEEEDDRPRCDDCGSLGELVAIKCGGYVCKDCWMGENYREGTDEPGTTKRRGALQKI